MPPDVQLLQNTRVFGRRYRKKKRIKIWKGSSNVFEEFGNILKAIFTFHLSHLRIMLIILLMHFKVSSDVSIVMETLLNI